MFPKRFLFQYDEFFFHLKKKQSLLLFIVILYNLWRVVSKIFNSQSFFFLTKITLPGSNEYNHHYIQTKKLLSMKMIRWLWWGPIIISSLTNNHPEAFSFGILRQEFMTILHLLHDVRILTFTWPDWQCMTPTRNDMNLW